MLIQWLVLTDKGWREVGDEAVQLAFTEAFQAREEQLQNFTRDPDLFHYEYPVWWGQRFEYAVNFRAMAQRNLETGMTRPIRLQILEVNTFEEARTLLLVANNLNTHPHGGDPSEGGDRGEGGGGERWSTAASSS